MLSKLDKSWTLKLRITVNNSTLYTYSVHSLSSVGHPTIGYL